MKHVIAFIAVLTSLSATNLFARDLKGRVIDAETSEGIPYASVSLHSLPDSAVIAYAITTADGEFQLQNVGDNPTNYLQVTYLGYITERRELSTFQSLSDIIITLHPSSVALNEVVVTERKKLIAIQPQGLSYDMANDVKSQTEDLLTALRRVPMITVDGLGQLMVRGKGNYSIYLNGKPFKSANLNPTQVLRSMPAANVLKVEVITNPDASYEAEAGSTIINIVTQGRRVLGRGGSVSLQAATKLSGSASLGYNLVAQRLKLSLSYDYNLDAQINQPVKHMRETMAPIKPSRLASDAHNDGVFQYHTGRMLLEAEIDSLNLIYADAHLRLTSTDYLLDWQHQYQEGNLHETTKTDTRSRYNDGSVESNIIYRNLHRGNKQEIFSAGYRFAYSPDVRSQEGTVRHNQSAIFSKNTSTGGLWEHAIQLDAMPFNRNGFVVKTGAIGTLRYGSSAPRYYTKSNEGDGWSELDIADDQQLKQEYGNIAGYINASYRHSRFSISAGARIEHSSSTLRRGKPQKTTTEKHLDVIPRVSLTFQPGESSQISLSYYNGIQRPSIWLLNPFVDKTDEYHSSTGNPDLVPQTNHNINLSSMIFSNNLFAQLSIDYEMIHKPILTTRWFENNNSKILHKSYFNGSRFQSITPSFMLNYKPTSTLSFNVFGNVGGLFFYGSRGELLQKNLTYGIFTNVDLTLPKGFYIGGMYGRSRVNPKLASVDKHSNFYSFYLTKHFMEGRYSLSLTADRPFQKYSEFRAKDWGAGFEQHRSYWITARSFGIRFVYNFGMGDKSSVKRNNKLKTTDLDRATGVK